VVTVGVVTQHEHAELTKLSANSIRFSSSVRAEIE
jgi:hypothetical protein